MILTALIFLATALLGGWTFVLLGHRGMDNLPVILSFGGSFIIGMCFLHLVPEAYDVTHLAGLFVLVGCLLYTSPSPRDKRQSRMPSSA